MTKPENKIDKLIAELCPEGVELKELGEIVEILDSQRKPVTKSERTGGEYPYYGANGIQDYVDDYIFDGTFILLGEDGSVINKDGSPVLNWATGKIWVNNHAHILAERSVIANLRYVFFALSVIDVTKVVKGNIPKITQENLRKFLIPIPPLTIQQEIVKMLDTFTTLEAELEAELEARKKQYEYYREELLTFNEDVEWKTLGDVYVFQYGEGNTIPTSGGEYPVYGSNGVVGSHSKYNSEDSPVIGHIGAYAGIVNWAQGKHFVTYNGVICRIKNGVNPKFGYYFMQLQDFRSMAKSGSQPFVSYDMLKKVKIPIPSLAEQERIVAILDKFDALVNDISVGLPAELNARRKQYEYYRNKLLTFQEKQ